MIHWALLLTLSTVKPAVMTKLGAHAKPGSPLAVATQRIDMEDETVEGRRNGPFGSVVTVRERRQFPSLLPVRTSFANEAARSLEEL